MTGVFFVFYGWVVFSATRADLPDQKKPLKFYSNQSRQDIKLTYLQALNKARHSIHLSIYGITDPQILDMISKKSRNNLSISIDYDPSASSPLKKWLPPSIQLSPIKSSGLMHLKILLIDHAEVYLGSANLTSSSLRHHANLVAGFFHPGLAAFLENPGSTSYFFEIQGQQGEVYLFPDPLKKGVFRLIQAIEKAQNKINVAMFTLTHPEIAEALVRAKKRNVKVTIALDAYTARGASKKTVEALEKEGVNFLLSQGRELLHHKWALIDDRELAMGSANWTKAAFNKNSDFLFFLSPLGKREKKILDNLWKTIESECIEYKNSS
jgi:phosphatidylserine/phosphatidylglycerophosphate/cardiolipin synthase-like enzyme